MTTVDSLATRFAHAWSRGERPDVDEYLALAPPGQREALAARLAAWVSVEPGPELSAGQEAEVAASPLVARILARTSGRAPGAAPAPGWAAELPRLRARAGLAVGDLARRLVPALGLQDAAAPKVAGYLEQMEQEALDPRRVSSRVLDALGDLLGTSAAALAAAARASVPAPLPTAASAAPLFRADEDAEVDVYLADIAAIGDLARTPAPDAVDRLFTGGRDA